MDSGRKRKATNDVSSTGTIKKIRLLNTKSDAPEEKATDKTSDVQKVGYKLVDQLGRAADKTGRPIATQFQSLPSKAELPDYYDFIRLPIAIETIRQKLDDGTYNSVTEIESDLKRMVQNAKDYNTAGSDVYEDAERIRKLVYNYMKVNNPEYSSNPQYVSFPTPVPKDANGQEPVKPDKKKRVSSVVEPPARRASVARSVSATNGAAYTGDDFTGKTFQQAQEMIVAGLLNHKDEGGLEIFQPFANLPSRKLEDYYKLIRHPVSIKGLHKRIQGIHGRDAPTGMTDFKTWDAFENEASWIWRNAREYNEDESDMYVLAGEFEEQFKLRLEAAKAKVEEPAGPRIKLGGPKPKVTLNLGQHRASPGAVQDGKIGTDSAVNGIARGGSVVDGRPVSSHTGSESDGIKLEKRTTQSPAPGLLPGLSLTNGMMPPPSIRPPSDSPMPNGHFPSSYTFTAPAALPPTPLRPYPASEALLPEIAITTPPYQKLDPPVELRIPPHETLCQQSLTITVPSTHQYLQISPTISRSLSMGRPYKMFVIINGTRLTQRDTILQDSGRRTHVYEGALAVGVNRVEIEVAAARDGEAKGLDIEKTTLYVNVMRP